MRRLRPVLLALALVPASGCSTLRSPTIKVEDVAVTDATDEALALGIAMELTNPNRAPLELYEFRYSVHVEGRQVYAGRRAGGATLSAAGSRRMTIPAVIPYHKIGGSESAVARRLRYTVSGRLVYNAPSQIAELLFDLGVRRPKVPFARRGSIEIRGGTPRGRDAETPP